jgi:carboxyl-terminal processing protease
MKQRFFSFLLCIALILSLSLSLPALASDAAPQTNGQRNFERMLEIIGLIQEYGLDSGEDDDPLRRAIEFISADPERAAWLRASGLSGGGADALRGALEAVFEDSEVFYWFADQMLRSYDRYSLYVPPHMYDVYFPIPESYVGVGIQLDTEMKGGWYIRDVIPQGPAEAAGLRAGDRIDRVDGVSVRGMELDELSRRVRGLVGTRVTLTIERYSEAGTQDFTLTRQPIYPVQITYEDLGGGVALVRIPLFADVWTYWEFFDVYTALPALGFDRVIIDVRDNRGGELGCYIDTVNLVLNTQGLPLLTARDRHGLYWDYYSVIGNTSFWSPEAVVVLMNENSLSAAELFAGTLRDYEKAALVGAVTGGKGYMQYHFVSELRDAVVLSVAEVLLPLSGSYDGDGIAPCYAVAMGSKPFPMPPLRNLNTAVNVSSGSIRIRELQEALTLLNYYRGGIDGVWNGALVYSIRAYQRDNGLLESHFANMAVIEQIRQDLDRLAATRVPVDTQLEKAIEVVRR